MYGGSFGDQRRRFDPEASRRTVCSQREEQGLDQGPMKYSSPARSMTNFFQSKVKPEYMVGVASPCGLKEADYP